MCRLHGFMVAMVSNQQGRCGQLQKWPWLFNFPIYYFPTPGIWAGFISYFGQFSSVQSLSRVQLFVTPWTAAYQASLSISNSWGLLKLMSIESVMPSNYATILSPSIFGKQSAVKVRVWHFQARTQETLNISTSSLDSCDHHVTKPISLLEDKIQRKVIPAKAILDYMS